MTTPTAACCSYCLNGNPEDCDGKPRTPAGTTMWASLLQDHLNSRGLRVVTQHTTPYCAIVTAEDPHTGTLVETWSVVGDQATLQGVPAEMTTPALVREFAARKAADARGDVCTRVQHDRHGAVVTELRARGVLD